MTNFPIELHNVRVFDVLRNALSGELGAVVGVEGDKIDMVTKTGAIVRFKHGEHLSRVSEDEAIAFRALTQALRRERLLASPRKPKRKPSVKAAAAAKLPKIPKRRNAHRR
ncbi:MAG: hypothetical protein ACHQ49_17895 [Elusimicrobiota bacterium]